MAIDASASDSDGTVVQVQFFAGTTLLGTTTNGPYSITWSNLVVGTYALTAVATDNDGLSATSSVVNITVTLPSPDSIKLWLKADVGTVLSSSNTVSTWQDQSGNGNNATQSTGASQPVWVDNTLNSRPVVRFDGANDYLALPNLLNGTTQAEAYVVLKAAADVPTADKSLWFFGAGNTGGRYPAVDGTITEGFGSSILRNIGNPTQPLDQYHLYDVAGAANQWSARVNGALQGNTSVNTYSYWTTPSLGWGQSVYFAGDIAEVLIFNRVLSSAERDAVNSYTDAHK